jgi:hypothetical protein
MGQEDWSRKEPPNLDDHNKKLRTFSVTGELMILKVEDKMINMKSKN